MVTTAIAHAYMKVPARERPRTLVLTQNYAQASAVNLFGRTLGLPEARSGHNTYWMWLPTDASIDSVFTVGFSASELHQWFGRCTPLGTPPRYSPHRCGGAAAAHVLVHPTIGDHGAALERGETLLVVGSAPLGSGYPHTPAAARDVFG